MAFHLLHCSSEVVLHEEAAKPSAIGAHANPDIPGEGDGKHHERCPVDFHAEANADEIAERSRNSPDSLRLSIARFETADQQEDPDHGGG